jgi:hypothetical protein
VQAALSDTPKTYKDLPSRQSPIPPNSAKPEHPIPQLNTAPSVKAALNKLREGFKFDGHILKHVTCQVYGEIMFDRGLFRSAPSINAESIKVLNGALYIYAIKWTLDGNSSGVPTQELRIKVISSLDAAFERLGTEMKPLSIDQLTLRAGLAGCPERNYELFASRR